MIYPKKLEKGSTIGIICPSSPISEEREQQCVSTLEGMGFKVKKADNLTKNYAGYMAGTGEDRAAWINKMFADEEVDAIFCVRGGDGGSRVIRGLDLDIVRKNPKIFVGYSDVTCLHMLFNQKCDLVTFHGPMVSSNMVDSFDDDTKNAFFDALTAENTYEFKNPAEQPLEVLKGGKATGPVIGGNLSLISAAVGTPSELDAEGKILFIEEVEEPLTKIEKWTYQLKLAGVFDKCKGVLLGQFTEVTNKYQPEYDVKKLYEDLLAEYDIPVMYNVQSGHGDKIITIPFGAECTMNTEDKTIVFKVER